MVSNDFDALTPAQKLELADLVIAQMAAASTVPFKPVDVANMPFLDEGDGSWVDEIVQLMPGHAVSAGAPDPANNKGLFNWPLQQLAQRTRALHTRLGGYGETALTTNGNLDTLGATADYLVEIGDVGSPEPTAIGAVSHTEGEFGAAWQFAVMSNGETYSRHRTDALPTWAAWERLTRASELQSNVEENGYFIYPTGAQGRRLIMQWGKAETNKNLNSTAITFPIAFPNACLRVNVSDWNADATANGSNHIVSRIESVDPFNPINFRVKAITYSGADASSVFEYFAIGY